MRWIALAGMVWGVVLGSINGPVIGGAVLAAGVVLVVVTSIAAGRAARAAQAAVAEAAESVVAERVEVPVLTVQPAVLYPALQSADVHRVAALALAA